MSTEMIHAPGNGPSGANGRMMTAAAGASDGALTPDQRRALMPQDYREAFGMAEHFAKSGMFGIRSPEQAVVILMTGLELGLPPATAMRGISVIQNRPSPNADTLLAVCLSARQVCRYFAPVHSDAQGATYRTHREGAPEPTEYTFTMDMARRAGLANKDTWKAHPEAMLRARCIAHLARMVYPDLTLGLYIPDEAESIPDRAGGIPERGGPDREAPALEQRPRDAEDRRVTRDGTPRAERTPPDQRVLPAPDPIVEERLRKVAAITDLLAGMDRDAKRSWGAAIKTRKDMEYAGGDVRKLNLAQLDLIINALKAGFWPDETPAAEAGGDAAEEADPFAEDDRNGHPDDQAALLTVPAAEERLPGHGDS